MKSEPDSKTYVEDMRSKIIDYITVTKESQSRIARELDVSKAVLSLFINNSYTGNNQEIAKKIDQYIEMGTSRKTVVQVPDTFLDLGNTAAILEKTKIAHLYNDMVLVYGPAGCGKTTALKHYAENNNGVIYVEADVTSNSHRSILSLIVSTMGETPKGSTANIMRTIIAKLTNTNRLIIIDEAQHLTEKAFDTIRAINDKARVGIVYAGNPSILKRMYGRMEDEFDQVYSRIVYKCPLSNRYSLEDISKVYEGYGINKEGLKYLYRISQRKGGLRLMVNQCKIALNLAAALNQEFSIEHLEKAAVMMGIGEVS